MQISQNYLEASVRVLFFLASIASQIAKASAQSMTVSDKQSDNALKRAPHAPKSDSNTKDLSGESKQNLIVAFGLIGTVAVGLCCLCWICGPINNRARNNSIITSGHGSAGLRTRSRRISNAAHITDEIEMGAVSIDLGGAPTYVVGDDAPHHDGFGAAHAAETEFSPLLSVHSVTKDESPRGGLTSPSGGIILRGRSLGLHLPYQVLTHRGNPFPSVASPAAAGSFVGIQMPQLQTR